LIAILLAGVLTALVSGNNLSVSVGTAVGARIISRWTGILIGISGYIAGLLIEGESLKYAASALLPHSYYDISVAFTISIAAFILATFLRAPLSLTMVLVGSVIGISIHAGKIPDQGLLLLIIIMWVASPVLSIVISYFSNKISIKHTPKDIWKTAISMKGLLIGASFLTAFTLGANTLGFILNLVGGNLIVTPIMIAGIITGSIVLSRGVIRRVGEEMYSMRYSSATISLLSSAILVEVATILGVPLSNSQTLSASVVGSGLSYRFKAINVKPFMIIVITWIISTILGFTLGYIF
ncbi:MAG: inorganic phosphate transporter, partial [Nitrososphaerota archaeon]